jgi:hypothetical protein
VARARQVYNVIRLGYNLHTPIGHPPHLHIYEGGITMRRAFTILIVLVAVLALTAGAEAAAPRPIEFVLMGHSVPNTGEITQRPHYIKIVGMQSEGVVTGDLEGTFTYTENIGATTDMERAVTKGDVTIQVGDDTISLRFLGVDQVFPQEYGPPTIVVVDQPWNFTGGTGQFEDIKGNGKRSTFTVDEGCPAEYEFCVRYTGKVH